MDLRGNRTPISLLSIPGHYRQHGALCQHETLKDASGGRLMCRLLATSLHLRARSNSTGLQPLYLQAMSAACSVTHFVALVGLTAGVAGC